MGIEIRRIEGEGALARSVEVIRESFRTVAEELGLTRENCPTHPSFIALEKLTAHVAEGLECFGLYDGGEQVGFVSAFPAGADVFYLKKLSVLPACRHRGYGRMLIDFVFSLARERGCSKISIALIDEGKILKRWYQDIGFHQTRTATFPHLPFTVCYMEKETA
jgi:ribosomal protein S18 acetylase RimI-like enzyme